MLSEVLRRQLLKILEDSPADLKSMIIVLTDYKNGKNLNLISWIETLSNKAMKS